MKSNLQFDAERAAFLTRAASRQTDLIIRYLVDPGMLEDAYRTYGYFRWVDDWLDCEKRPRPECIAFITRQQNLMEACYRAEPTGDVSLEESMLVNLIAGDSEPNSGLQAYIRNMMSVMIFDADRRERLISARELEEYTAWLAAAVTEALHYFIGHTCASPQCEARYQAVSGAHITHMLRDAVEDAEAGYYNIPYEILSEHQITPLDFSAPAYRAWVKTRVQQARACFRLGKEYLARVESLRCRFAGCVYMHRFEIVLDRIEQEDYLLKKQLPERKSSLSSLEMTGLALWQAIKYVPAFSFLHHAPQVKS
jgi:phytoene/squalene synthetase